MPRPVTMSNHPVRVAAERAMVNPSLIVQRGKGWVKVNEEACCRMCRRSRMIRPLTRHHIVPQSYFRARPKLAPLRHADANIVPLCTRCHRDVERSTPHARIELRRLLGPSEIAFAIQVAGRVWLDRRYPAATAAGRRVAQSRGTGDAGSNPAAAPRSPLPCASSPGWGSTA